VGDPGYDRAAVAIVLRDSAAGIELLTIRRSERPGDPWSGHMAFPGGRQHRSDTDLFVTAARETREEVGIDLGRQGELLGSLDDLRAYGHGRPLDMIIRPFVCALTVPVQLHLDHREVHSALWVPLPSLLGEKTRGSVLYEIAGQQTQHEAFVYRGHHIWGLTYRILSQFLSLLH
jgi:8-oxo-dGTP pyrophosphatase MutT (NUDIX family)